MNFTGENRENREGGISPLPLFPPVKPLSVAALVMSVPPWGFLGLISDGLGVVGLAVQCFGLGRLIADYFEL